MKGLSVDPRYAEFIELYSSLYWPYHISGLDRSGDRNKLNWREQVCESRCIDSCLQTGLKTKPVYCMPQFNPHILDRQLHLVHKMYVIGH